MIESSNEAESIKMGSERSFGLVFAIVFASIALWPLTQGGVFRVWAIVVALTFLALGYMRPAVLGLLNAAWFRLALLLSAVVTPIVIAVLYVATFLPMSLFLRLVGRDLLGLRQEPDRTSYWLIRDPPGPAQGTMKQQF